MAKSKAFIRGRWLWAAWYPARGRRCQFEWTRDTQNLRPHLTVALGPAYLGLGPGIPRP